MRYIFKSSNAFFRAEGVSERSSAFKSEMREEEVERKGRTNLEVFHSIGKGFEGILFPSNLHCAQTFSKSHLGRSVKLI